MSAKTVAAVVNVEDHADELKEHPAGKFIVEYANAFDAGDHTAAGSYHHPTKAVYIKSDGTSYSGADCYPQILKDYAVFTKVHHEPKTLLVYESHEMTDHYEVLGTANVLGNLVGDRAPDEPEPIRGRKGEEWDVSIPGAFHFYIEKSEGAEHDGMVITKTIVYSDSGPVMARLLKRGVLKPSDLGL